MVEAKHRTPWHWSQPLRDFLSMTDSINQWWLSSQLSLDGASESFLKKLLGQKREVAFSLRIKGLGGAGNEAPCWPIQGSVLHCIFLDGIFFGGHFI